MLFGVGFCPRVFVRRVERQRQSVQAGGEFARQRGIHRPVPRDPGQALKSWGNHQHRIMRFAARAGAGMAGMAGAVIGDGEQAGREGLAQDGFDAVGAGRWGHGADINETRPGCNLADCNLAHAQLPSTRALHINDL